MVSSDDINFPFISNPSIVGAQLPSDVASLNDQLIQFSEVCISKDVTLKIMFFRISEK